jgi:prepilin-type processing-associated H-X9-DG protein
MIVLTGLLFAPAVLRWRNSADRVRSVEHLRQVAWFAVWEYTDRSQLKNLTGWLERLPADAKVAPEAWFPPGTRAHATLPPSERQSLQVLLLPHLRGVRPSQPTIGERLAPQFVATLPWNAPAHQSAVQTVVPVYVCPSVYTPPAQGEPAVTHFIGCAGAGADAAELPLTNLRAGLFRYDAATPATAVADGFSHTIAFFESVQRVGPWAQGGPSTVRGLDPAQPLFGPVGQLGGAYPGGAHTAFADGSVRWQAESISPAILAQLAALADGQNSE